mmetsp:Transcript_40652/g.118566  ORF Transcript_40652/g.118566 Transcript_40652/m.118566 type:complete len:203 (-) Transcript_40652:73-681(-)
MCRAPTPTVSSVAAASRASMSCSPPSTRRHAARAAAQGADGARRRRGRGYQTSHAGYQTSDTRTACGAGRGVCAACVAGGVEREAYGPQCAPPRLRDAGHHPLVRRPPPPGGHRRPRGGRRPGAARAHVPARAGRDGQSPRRLPRPDHQRRDRGRAGRRARVMAQRGYGPHGAHSSERRDGRHPSDQHRTPAICSHFSLLCF